MQDPACAVSAYAKHRTLKRLLRLTLFTVVCTAMKLSGSVPQQPILLGCRIAPTMLDFSQIVCPAFAEDPRATLPEESITAMPLAALLR
jgi:hypothetical protein